MLLLMIIFKEFKVKTVFIMYIFQHNKISNTKMAFFSSYTEEMNKFHIIISVSLAQVTLLEGSTAKIQF